MIAWLQRNRTSVRLAFGLRLAVHVCRHLGISAWRWTAKSLLIPLLAMLAAASRKATLPDESHLHLGKLAVGCAA